jgi:hypothetical protein
LVSSSLLPLAYNIMSTSIGPLECTAYPSKIRLAPFWRGATSSGEMVEPLVYRKELLRCEEDVVLVVVVVWWWCWWTILWWMTSLLRLLSVLSLSRGTYCVLDKK